MQIKGLGDLWVEYGRNIRRLLPTFLDNRRVFTRLEKPRRGPLAAVFNMSSVCDARCVFCDYWKRDTTEERELSTEDKVRVIEQLSVSGVWLVSFCSAEPLLSDDLALLIKEAGKRKMLVNISTNGSMLEEKAEMLVDLGVDTVTVSIDSHDPHVHDSLRGYPGLFDRAEKGIARLRSLRGRRRPRLTARHLLNGRNCFALEEFVRYWAPKVDRIILKPVYASGDGVFHIPEDLKLRPEDEREFRKYFNDFLLRYPELDTQYHRIVPDQLFSLSCGFEWYCFAGTFFTDLDRQGNVCPCTELGLKFGNVLEKGFLDVWRSASLQDFRRELKEKKKCPSCWGDKFSAGIKVQDVLKLTGAL